MDGCCGNRKKRLADRTTGNFVKEILSLLDIRGRMCFIGYKKG